MRAGVILRFNRWRDHVGRVVLMVFLIQDTQNRESYTLTLEDLVEQPRRRAAGPSQILCRAR
jgi:hypothetical protein